jgi:hypothetical protein
MTQKKDEAPSKVDDIRISKSWGDAASPKICFTGKRQLLELADRPVYPTAGVLSPLKKEVYCHIAGSF